MEANQINEAPATVSETATGESKMSKGQMIGMVVLTIVALAGVAFGVWGMVGKSEAEKAKDLAIKITEAGGKVTDIVTDKITSIDKDGTVTEITDTNVTTEVVNPEDYIYIGEWGIKIKKPMEWRLMIEDYAFYNGIQALDRFEIDELRTDAEIDIYRRNDVECGEPTRDEIVCFKIDDYSYFVNQKVEGWDGNEPSKGFKAHLANTENYSKI